MSSKILDGVQTRRPDLDAFDEKIYHLYQVRDSINDMKQVEDIFWLRVNSSPLIKELQKIVNEWIEMHTQFLLKNTV